jgi:hypothetical protein
MRSGQAQQETKAHTGSLPHMLCTKLTMNLEIFRLLDQTSSDSIGGEISARWTMAQDVLTHGNATMAQEGEKMYFLHRTSGIRIVSMFSWELKCSMIRPVRCSAARPGPQLKVASFPQGKKGLQLDPSSESESEMESPGFFFGHAPLRLRLR